MACQTQRFNARTPFFRSADIPVQRHWDFTFVIAAGWLRIAQRLSYSAGGHLNPFNRELIGGIDNHSLNRSHLHECLDINQQPDEAD
jgi:hypothetical protein